MPSSTPGETSGTPQWEKFLPDDYLDLAAVEQYETAYRYLQGSIYLKYPQVISFETIASCNAACSFCPYPDRTDKGTRMPSDLVSKIIQDMQDIPRDVPFLVTLARINEPFLDKRIFDIARKINDTLPHASLIFFSNGTPLTEQALDKLSSLERVLVMNVSFNDHRPSAYENVMKLPYLHTLERLDALHRRVESGDIRFAIRISRVSDGTPADQDFLQFVRLRWPRFDIANYRKADWLGQKHSAISPVPDSGCQQWFTLSFLASGQQTFCCLDSTGQFGSKKNIRDHHLLEIYNLPERLKLRENILSRKQVGICSNCSLLA